MPEELLPVPTRISRTARNGRIGSSSANSSPPGTGQTAHEATPSHSAASHEFASQSDASPDLFNSPFDLDPNIPSHGTTTESLENWWNLDPTLLSLTQEGDSSHILQHQPFQFSDIPIVSDSVNSPGSQYDLVPRSLTPGQASLFQALFSLSDSTSDPGPATSTTLIGYPPSSLSSWSSHSVHVDVGREDDGDEDESVKQIIYGTMRLDMNAEGNALPYVLESYAAWITRTAFEPKKAAPGARDFILKQFGDSEDSRWTVTTLARVVRTLAESSTWGAGLDSLKNMSYLPAVRALRERVHQRVDEILSYSGPVGEHELSNALKVVGNVMEITSIYYTTASLLDALDFMRTAAPLFRYLCPDPPEKPIQLQALLLQPIISLRHYAIVDIFSCIPVERNMLFYYDTTYDASLSQPVIPLSGEAGLQWLHGIPSVIVIVFARVNTMRDQGYANSRAVAEIESMLRNFVAIPCVSSDPFLTVSRIMVQECWRQVAFIYLYMGGCHLNADDEKVKKALSRFMKLLEGTKPGHTPDAFLMMNCLIGGLAARNNCDREVIRHRMLNSERFKYPGAQGNIAVMLLEYIWLRTDGERRPAVWDDLQVATRQATQRHSSMR
ncbi:hypothetical protein FRC11_005145 [Ceratobasidium sp. 423]|nr:hypothetical protein FRC11_005145 [Ceratobasidium sp. 423]